MAESVRDTEMPRTGIARHPISPILLPVPIVCFVGALITDFLYDQSGGNLIWVNFSSWLLAAGLLFGGIVIFLRRRKSKFVRFSSGSLPLNTEPSAFQRLL